MIRRFPGGVAGGGKRSASAARRSRIALVAAAVLLWSASGLSGPQPLRAAEVPSPNAAESAAALTDRGDPARNAPAPLAGEERRELWTGSLYTSTYRIGLCVKPSGEARGVVLLRLRNGDVDVYHVKGAVQNGRITARHHSGHRFEGKYTSPDTVDGAITLRSGRTVSLTAKRTPHARLTGDDCRPLPE